MSPPSPQVLSEPEGPTSSQLAMSGSLAHRWLGITVSLSLFSALFRAQKRCPPSPEVGARTQAFSLDITLMFVRVCHPGFHHCADAPKTNSLNEKMVI